jgi:hypothetical protein
VDDHVWVAYHEAGHAVASYALGIAIDHVSILSDETTLGHCASSTRWDEPSIICWFAGGIAERIFTGHRPTSSRVDMICVMHALYLTDNPTVDAIEPNAFRDYMASAICKARFYHLRAQSAQLLVKHWDAVNLLAQMLIYDIEISGDTINRVISQGGYL